MSSCIISDDFVRDPWRIWIDLSTGGQPQVLSHLDLLMADINANLNMEVGRPGREDFHFILGIC